MQCYNCKHDFCWMCLGDWKSHGSEYYECSRYRENPNIAHESVHAQVNNVCPFHIKWFKTDCSTNKLKQILALFYSVRKRNAEIVLYISKIFIFWMISFTPK